MEKRKMMKSRAMIIFVVTMLVASTFSVVVLDTAASTILAEDETESTPVITSNGGEVKNKTMYMYHVQDAVGVGGRTTKEIYNTTYPVGDGHQTDPSSYRVLVDWYLFPPLAGDLQLEGTSTLTVWANRSRVDPGAGGGGVTMTYELWEVDEEGNEFDIASDEVSRTIERDTWMTYEVTVNIEDTYTVSEGSTLKVTLDIEGDSANEYWIAYGGIVDGGMRDTNVTLPCRNYINVSDVYTTNHEGNITNLFSPEAANQTIYIHANITNPFGGYDIKWVNLTLEAPNGDLPIELEAMDKIYGFFNSYESRYRYEWNYSDEQEGTYEVEIRAVDNTGHKAWSQTDDFGGHDEYGYHSFVIGGLDHYVNIRISDDHGHILPNVTVLLKVSETMAFATNVTDDGGITNFTVANVTYLISVIWQDVEVSTNRTLDIGATGNRTRHNPYNLTAGVFYPSFQALDMEGDPVDGANIYLGHPNGTSLIEPIVTNSTGRFNLEQTAEGTYNLEAEWKGRDVGSFEVEVSSSEEHPFNVHVYHLTIRVLDDSGAPVSNALVVASYDDTMIVAESKLTNPDGELDTRLPATDYFFEVYWNDAIVYEDTYTLSSSGTLVITAGIYEVTVIVNDSLNDTLEGADVIAIYTETGREIDTGTTDENGTVYFQLAAGEHRFNVSWLGIEVASEVYVVSESETVFEITTSVYQLNIIAIDGTVDENVLSEARISIRIDENLVDTGLTDESGSYVSKLPGTSIDIEVEWKGIVVHNLEGYQVEGNDDLELYCNVYYLDINVEDSQNEPIEGVNLRIEYQGELMVSSSSDEDGLIRTRLPVETYTIEARWYGVLVGEEEYTMIAAQGENEVLLSCDVYYLTITVVDAENETLADTRVEFYLEGNHLFSELTDQAGVLTARLPKETFHLSFTWRGFDIAESEVTMEADEELTVQAAVYHVSLTPVDSQDEIVSQAEIIITHDNTIFERERIGEDGGLLLLIPQAEFTVEVIWQGVKVYEEVYTFSQSEDMELSCEVYYLTIGGIDSREQEVNGLIVTIYHNSLPEGQDLLTTIDIDENPTVRLPWGNIRLQGEWRGFFIADESLELSSDREFELQCDIYYLDVTVVDSEGVSLDGADLVLKDHTGTAFVTEVTYMGAATPRLPKGTWTLEAYWRGHKVGTLVTDIEDEDTDIRLETAVHYLRIEVEGRKGPIEGVELTLLDSDGIPLISLETGEYGKVEFAQIVEGDYTLVGRLKTTQLMTDIDLEETTEVGLYSSQDILLNFEEYPIPIYKTNLFYVVVLIVVILTVGMVAIAKKKEVL